MPFIQLAFFCTVSSQTRHFFSRYMWIILHIVYFSQQFKHASWLVKHKWQSHWSICLKYFWSAIEQAIIFMKFHIRLDSDNIFNVNSYFVSGFFYHYDEILQKGRRTGALFCRQRQNFTLNKQLFGVFSFIFSCKK